MIDGVNTRVKEYNKKQRIILLSRGLTTSIAKELLSMHLGTMWSEDRTILIIEPNEKISEILKEACEKIGFISSEIRCSYENPDREICYDYVYVGEGNSFEILDYMRKNQWLDYVKKALSEGTCYIGASAGAAIIGQDIKLIRHVEKDFIGLTSYKTLGLFDGAIIPHYTRKELIRFLQNVPTNEINVYQKITNIQNNEMIILEDGKAKRVRVAE